MGVHAGMPDVWSTQPLPGLEFDATSRAGAGVRRSGSGPGKELSSKRSDKALPRNLTVPFPGLRDWELDARWAWRILPNALPVGRKPI